MSTFPNVPRRTGSSWIGLVLSAAIAAAMTSVAAIVIVDRHLENRVFQPPPRESISMKDLEQRLQLLRAEYGSVHESVKQLAANDNVSVQNMSDVVSRIGIIAETISELTEAAERDHNLGAELSSIAVGLGQTVNTIDAKVKRIDTERGADKTQLLKLEAAIDKLVGNSKSIIPKLQKGLHDVRCELSDIKERLIVVETKVLPMSDD